MTGEQKTRSAVKAAVACVATLALAFSLLGTQALSAFGSTVQDITAKWSKAVVYADVYGITDDGIAAFVEDVDENLVRYYDHDANAIIPEGLNAYTSSLNKLSAGCPIISVENPDGLWGTVDLEGNIVIEPQYNNLRVSNSGYSAGMKYTKSADSTFTDVSLSIIDPTGKVFQVIPLEGEYQHLNYYIEITAKGLADFQVFLSTTTTGSEYKSVVYGYDTATKTFVATDRSGSGSSSDTDSSDIVTINVCDPDTDELVACITYPKSGGGDVLWVNLKGNSETICTIEDGDDVSWIDFMNMVRVRTNYNNASSKYYTPAGEHADWFDGKILRTVGSNVLAETQNNNEYIYEITNAAGDVSQSLTVNATGSYPLVEIRGFDYYSIVGYAFINGENNALYYDPAEMYVS